jgi:Rrf2 family protein
MLVLKGAGYVSSRRGAGGGFALTRSPEQVTVGEIVRLIEGPIGPISCAQAAYDSDCGEEACCAFREVWVKVTECVSEIIDGVTFADIMRRVRDLRVQKTGYTYQI